MADWSDAVSRKLQEHSSLGDADIAAIRSLPHSERVFGPSGDIVRQGDKPDVSVVVQQGTVARYHTLPGGRRQYLSLHIAGDMPDAQSLFLDRMSARSKKQS
jgi:CRP-like cAMP-binding protein